MDSNSIARKGLWVRIPPAALMRSTQERIAVQRLAAAGHAAPEIARRTGVLVRLSRGG